MRKLFVLILATLLIPAFALAAEPTDVYIEEFGLTFTGPAGYLYEVQREEDSLTILLTDEEDTTRGYLLMVTLDDNGEDIADLNQESAEAIARNVVDLIGIEGSLNFESLNDSEGNISALVLYNDEETVLVLMTYTVDYTLFAMVAADDGVTQEDVQVLETLMTSVVFDSQR